MYLGQMIGRIVFRDSVKLNGFHSVSIKKSVHQIVQTAKLTIPMSVLLENQHSPALASRLFMKDVIKEGDKINISFGYRKGDIEDVKQEFTGYIRSINYKIPVEIECEDAMYLFRNTTIKQSFNGVDIKEVLLKICVEVTKKYQVAFKLYDKMPQITVSNFIVNNQSAMWALQQLIDWYPMLGIYLTQINGEEVLYCGLVYQDLGKPNVEYGLSGPINNTISVSELKYQTTTKTAKVVWKITQPNGTVVTKEIGDSNAELVINKKISGKVNDDLLKQMTNQEVSQKNYVGYNGNFTAFLYPFCDFGVVASLQDPQFPERKGNYFVGTVTTTFDTSTGGRRKPEIDFKLR